MRAETSRRRIASTCLNQLEEMKTKRQDPGKEWGRENKKTEARRQRFDPHQNAKGSATAGKKRYINTPPRYQKTKEHFLVCAQVAAQAFSSSDSNGITNQLHCFKILPHWWRWMIPSLLPSLLFYPPPQSPVLSPLITVLFSHLLVPLVFVLSRPHTHTHTVPTHPPHEFSSTPLPSPLAEILPPSRPGIWVDKWRSDVAGRGVNGCRWKWKCQTTAGGTWCCLSASLKTLFSLLPPCFSLRLFTSKKIQPSHFSHLLFLLTLRHHNLAFLANHSFVSTGSGQG